MRIENAAARQWYADEAADENWSVRALERQIGTLYYERLLASKDKSVVEQEAQDKTEPLQDDPKHYLRDPYILDFLNLQDKTWQESDLEQGIISNLQQFLLELGELLMLTDQWRGGGRRVGHRICSLYRTKLLTLKGNGAPDRIRTCDPCLRRAVLYPAELRVRKRGMIPVDARFVHAFGVK